MLSRIPDITAKAASGNIEESNKALEELFSIVATENKWSLDNSQALTSMEKSVQDKLESVKYVVRPFSEILESFDSQAKKNEGFRVFLDVVDAAELFNRPDLKQKAEVDLEEFTGAFDALVDKVLSADKLSLEELEMAPAVGLLFTYAGDLKEPTVDEDKKKKEVLEQYPKVKDLFEKVRGINSMQLDRNEPLTVMGNWVWHFKNPEVYETDILETFDENKALKFLSGAKRLENPIEFADKFEKYVVDVQAIATREGETIPEEYVRRAQETIQKIRDNAGTPEKKDEDVGEVLPSEDSDFWEEPPVFPKPDVLIKEPVSLPSEDALVDEPFTEEKAREWVDETVANGELAPEDAELLLEEFSENGEIAFKDLYSARRTIKMDLDENKLRPKDVGMLMKEFEEKGARAFQDLHVNTTILLEMASDGELNPEDVDPLIEVLQTQGMDAFGRELRAKTELLETEKRLASVEPPAAEAGEPALSEENQTAIDHGISTALAKELHEETPILVNSALMRKQLKEEINDSRQLEFVRTECVNCGEYLEEAAAGTEIVEKEEECEVCGSHELKVVAKKRSSLKTLIEDALKKHEEGGKTETPVADPLRASVLAKDIDLAEVDDEWVAERGLALAGGRDPKKQKEALVDILALEQKRSHADLMLDTDRTRAALAPQVLEQLESDQAEFNSLSTFTHNTIDKITGVYHTARALVEYPTLESFYEGVEHPEDMQEEYLKSLQDNRRAIIHTGKLTGIPNVEELLDARISELEGMVGDEAVVHDEPGSVEWRTKKIQNAIAADEKERIAELKEIADHYEGKTDFADAQEKKEVKAVKGIAKVLPWFSMTPEKLGTVPVERLASVIEQITRNQEGLVRAAEVLGIPGAEELMSTGIKNLEEMHKQKQYRNYLERVVDTDVKVLKLERESTLSLITQFPENPEYPNSLKIIDEVFEAHGIPLPEEEVPEPERVERERPAEMDVLPTEAEELEQFLAAKEAELEEATDLRERKMIEGEKFEIQKALLKEYNKRDEQHKAEMDEEKAEGGGVLEVIDEMGADIDRSVDRVTKRKGTKKSIIMDGLKRDKSKLPTEPSPESIDAAKTALEFSSTHPDELDKVPSESDFEDTLEGRGKYTTAIIDYGKNLQSQYGLTRLEADMVLRLANRKLAGEEPGLEAEAEEAPSPASRGAILEVQPEAAFMIEHPDVVKKIIDGDIEAKDLQAEPYTLDPALSHSLVARVGYFDIDLRKGFFGISAEEFDNQSKELTKVGVSDEYIAVANTEKARFDELGEDYKPSEEFVRLNMEMTNRLLEEGGAAEQPAGEPETKTEETQPPAAIRVEETATTPVEEGEGEWGDREEDLELGDEGDISSEITSDEEEKKLNEYTDELLAIDTEKLGDIEDINELKGYVAKLDEVIGQNVMSFPFVRKDESIDLEDEDYHARLEEQFHSLEGIRDTVKQEIEEREARPGGLRATKFDEPDYPTMNLEQVKLAYEEEMAKPREEIDKDKLEKLIIRLGEINFTRDDIFDLGNTDFVEGLSDDEYDLQYARLVAKGAPAAEEGSLLNDAFKTVSAYLGEKDYHKAEEYTYGLFERAGTDPAVMQKLKERGGMTLQQYTSERHSEPGVSDMHVRPRQIKDEQEMIKQFLARQERMKQREQEEEVYDPEVVERVSPPLEEIMDGAHEQIPPGLEGVTLEKVEELLRYKGMTAQEYAGWRVDDLMAKQKYTREAAEQQAELEATRLPTLTQGLMMQKKAELEAEMEIEEATVVQEETGEKASTGAGGDERITTSKAINKLNRAEPNEDPSLEGLVFERVRDGNVQSHQRDAAVLALALKGWNLTDMTPDTTQRTFDLSELAESHFPELMNAAEDAEGKSGFIQNFKEMLYEGILTGRDRRRADEFVRLYDKEESAEEEPLQARVLEVIEGEPKKKPETPTKGKGLDALIGGGGKKTRGKKKPKPLFGNIDPKKLEEQKRQLAQEMQQQKGETPRKKKVAKPTKKKAAKPIKKKVAKSRTVKKKKAKK
ncbi:hypothetical protein ACFLQ2_05310 [archaeon]